MVDIFNPNERVDVIGTSKGRGFAGLIKRHHFRGGRASQDRCSTAPRARSALRRYPSRVLKGMRMAGHMGDARVTVRNLQVARIDQENNLLFVRGAVPGPAGALRRRGEDGAVEPRSREKLWQLWTLRI